MYLTWIYEHCKPQCSIVSTYERKSAREMRYSAPVYLVGICTLWKLSRTARVLHPTLFKHITTHPLKQHNGFLYIPRYSNHLVELSPTALTALSTFKKDPSLFALLLSPYLSNSGTSTTITLDPVSSPLPFPSSPSTTTTTSSKDRLAFQHALNTVEPHLKPRSALYILLRCRRRHPPSSPPSTNNGTAEERQLVFITYIPYQAPEASTTALLSHRSKILQHLDLAETEQVTGSVLSLVCKEVGEIADIRSWDEREGVGRVSSKGIGAWRKDMSDAEDAKKEGKGDGDGQVEKGSEEGGREVKNIGFQRNKCRLCDRRMKNQIDDDALTALSTRLVNRGDCVVLVRLFLPLPFLISPFPPDSTMLMECRPQNIHPGLHPDFHILHPPDFLGPILYKFVSRRRAREVEDGAYHSRRGAGQCDC
ncbi:unnamed protein product [Periconia digitata]|uniref:Uncharacterized protein n=1 Tax=Periconia digitata TaxID=1303443 RepID=A0A9W4UJZ2_9PLEO|nr:unnamed protein product [Periconia digitata]